MDESIEAVRLHDAATMSAIPSSFAVSPAASQKATRNPGNNQLSPAQQKQVEELKKRDTDVRLHEAAHFAAALAPADPSSEDRAVAAQAAAKAAQAQAQLGAPQQSDDSKGKVLDTFA
jgi:hypothetical protein